MELLRVLGVMAESAGAESAKVARLLGLADTLDPPDHTELFTLQLVPYASAYLGEQGKLGGEARDRIAGFWRAAGAVPPEEPDHVTTLLAAYASLVESEEDATPEDRPAWRRLRHALFWEHLASWVFVWLARAVEVAPGPYAGWASLLADTLAEEAERLGPPTELPLHLRVAPPVAAEEKGDAFLDALLAPARSGLVLTRADLARAARTTGLGLRLGERRYILHNLFRQAPTETAGWLADEARRQATLHAAQSAAFGPVMRHWRQRALDTAARLTEAATAAPALEGTE